MNMTRTKANRVIVTRDMLLLEGPGDPVVIRGGEIDIDVLTRKDRALVVMLNDSLPVNADNDSFKQHLPQVDRLSHGTGWRLSLPRNSQHSEVQQAWALCGGSTETAALLGRMSMSGLTEIEFAEGASPLLTPLEAAEITDDPVILREAYGTWGEHPEISHDEWQAEVAELNTVLGYWEHVSAQLENNREVTPELLEQVYKDDL